MAVQRRRKTDIPRSTPAGTAAGAFAPFPGRVSAACLDKAQVARGEYRLRPRRGQDWPMRGSVPLRKRRMLAACRKNTSNVSSTPRMNICEYPRNTIQSVDSAAA